MKTKFRLQKIARYFLYTLLAAFLFTACEYPVHKVFEGKQSLIVYKVEKIDDAKNGTYKYAITDATEKGWTLKSFKKFEVGDTLHISK